MKNTLLETSIVLLSRREAEAPLTLDPTLLPFSLIKPAIGKFEIARSLRKTVFQGSKKNTILLGISFQIPDFFLEIKIKNRLLLGFQGKRQKPEAQEKQKCLNH